MFVSSASLCIISRRTEGNMQPMARLMRVSIVACRGTRRNQTPLIQEDNWPAAGTGGAEFRLQFRQTDEVSATVFCFPTMFNEGNCLGLQVDADTRGC